MKSDTRRKVFEVAEEIRSGSVTLSEAMAVLVAGTSEGYPRAGAAIDIQEIYAYTRALKEWSGSATFTSGGDMIDRAQLEVLASLSRVLAQAAMRFASRMSRRAILAASEDCEAIRILDDVVGLAGLLDPDTLLMLFLVSVGLVEEPLSEGDVTRAGRTAYENRRELEREFEERGEPDDDECPEIEI
jgi:hypothetical protein